MKKKLPLPAVTLLVAGLLILSAGMIGHKFQLSDRASGFIGGLGIGLELVAAFAIVRHKSRLGSVNSR